MKLEISEDEVHGFQIIAVMIVVVLVLGFCVPSCIEKNGTSDHPKVNTVEKP